MGTRARDCYLCFFCVCPKMKGHIAALERLSRQRARDGVVF